MREGRGGNSGLERLKGSLWCVLCLGGSSVLPLTLWALQASHFPPTPHVQSSVLALCFTDFCTSPQCRHNTPATSWKSVKQTEPEEAQLLHPGLGAKSQARTFHSFLSLLSWIPQWKHEVCSFYTNENFTQTGKKNTSFQYPEFKAIQMLYRSFTDSDTSKPSKAGIWMMNTICRGLDSAEEIRPYHHYTHPFHLQLLRTPDKSGPSCSGWSTKHIHPIKIQPIKTTVGDKEHVPLVTKKINKKKIRTHNLLNFLIINLFTKTPEPQETPHTKEKSDGFLKIKKTCNEQQKPNWYSAKYHSCLKIQNILNNHKALALSMTNFPHGNAWL